MYNTNKFAIILNFLVLMAASLSTQLQSELKNPGKVRLDDQVLYIKKEIAGGGTVKLLTGATERLAGICSFDKNRLQPGRAFVFNRVSVEYATDAASGKEGSLAYTTAAPAELQNADFVISQNGQEVYRMPVRDVTNIDAGQTIADAYTKTNSLRFLNDIHTIDINFEFPDGVVLSGAAKHYVFVRLNGLQTQAKS